MAPTALEPDMTVARYREPGIEIESYTSISDEFAGTHDSWWGVAKMHVKAQNHDLPYLIANELICCRLAAALGLPVLPGEVAKHPDGRQCWVTPQISQAGMTVPPTRESEILGQYASTVAGAFVFDCWVLNEDRHEENFLFHPVLGMWLIDHDNALAGNDGARFETFAARFDMPLDWHGFSAAALPQQALEFWCWRVQSVPDAAIDLALGEVSARGLMQKSRTATLRRLLRSRRESIAGLVRQSLAQTRTDVASEIQLSFDPA
ncbi:hypothetical protein [Nocardia sp. NBC_01327]|uniref:hypothetical protein n=1 Tax=Nocardia sp. NBC_01327 TaxID=2903593 RepID=UPI002E0E8574|nr:hypothetical protein OG326_14940 [Nocardia sp. NBC_01327]